MEEQLYKMGKLFACPYNQPHTTDGSIMRLRFFLYLLAPFLLSAKEAEPSRSPEWPIEQPQSEDEALFLRRIADFWQE